MNTPNQSSNGDPGPSRRDGYGADSGYGYGNPYGYSVQRSNDLARTWHTLVEKVWVIILCMLLLLGVGYAYIRRAPVTYSATATIQAEQDQPDILKMQMIQVKDFNAVDYLQTVAQTIASRPLLEQVADAQHLWDDQRFLTRTNSGAGPQAMDDRDRVLNALEGMVQVKLRRGTRLIDITVKHRVPELAQVVANSIVDTYIKSRVERMDSTIGTANESLSREAEKLRKKLEQSENALQAYKEQNNASSLDDRQNTVVAKLNELSTRATEAKSVRIKAEAEYDQALKVGTNVEELLNLPAVGRDPSVISLQTTLAKAAADFAGLQERYKEKHPKYVQAQKEIAQVRKDLSVGVLGAVDALKAGVESARSAETALNVAMHEQEAAALKLSQLAIDYGALRREVATDQALYEAVLKGMKEASVSQAIQQGGVIRVVEPAYLPERPIWPRKQAIMALAGMGGIFLGVMIVLGLRVTDTTIKTVDEAEAGLGLSVMSVVPNMSGMNNGHSRLVLLDNARSPAAESFRTLRTSLTTLCRGEERKVWLFTSAMPAEGKTFCSVNYATSLAQIGRKTLLIDADLRHPSVESTVLGKDSEAPGLCDYLTGQKTFEQAVQATKVENLSIMTAGTTAPNPAELLARDGLRALVQEALKRYDRVVVDSAPINAVSDTLLMLKSVESVCLVVRAARTSSRYVRRCVQLLQSAEAPISGVVLNRMPQRRRLGYGAYYDYDYHGKYGKKGVYGSK